MGRPLRYSINVTLDGCADHRAGIPNEDSHRVATEALEQSDAMLLGRVTYEMMEAGWRDAPPGDRPEWMEPFARSIGAIRKYVVSSTLKSVDWNAELIHGDLERSVRALKQQPGKGIGTGGLTLPRALAEMGLIDEYIVVVHPRIAGHGPKLFDGLSRYVDLELVDRKQLGSGMVVLRYVPKA